MSEWVFLTGLLIAGSTLAIVVRSIAGAIGGRGLSRSEIMQLRDQLDQNTAALEDAQAGLASQASQLSELHERLDFAERLLAQGRERAALKPGDKQE